MTDSISNKKMKIQKLSFHPLYSNSYQSEVFPTNSTHFQSLLFSPFNFFTKTNRGIVKNLPHHKSADTLQPRTQ